jgi:rod shape-determining protein MreC
LKKTHRKAPWIVAIAAVLAVATFVISWLLGGSAGPVSGALGLVFTPVRSGMSTLAGWIEDRYNYAFRYDELVQENEQLKLTIAELEKNARQAQEALEENERYRDLLGLAQKREDLTLVSAYITARGASSWSSTLTLNKGSTGGVAAGNCVIDQYGNLVGVVDQVSESWCTLITVVDAEIEMGGTVGRTNSAAILEGDLALMGQGKLKLTYLPESTQLLSGDQVLTSGMGGVYPSGLVVGTIDEILTEASGMGRYAILTPATQLDELRQVFVITDFDIVE